MDYRKFIEKRLIKLASIPTSCSPAPEYSFDDITTRVREHNVKI